MISFLIPTFLFALSLVAIPILIHLFNFRKFKKAYFTNVRFLQELKEETTRLSRLKHLLVLACRILAVIFLVLAFAQPIIPVGKAANRSANRSVSIYVDNSFSMEGITREGTLLDVARRKAREIASAYSASTKFQLLTNDFEAVHQRMFSRDEFLEELDHVKVSPVSRMLSSVVSRQEEALNQSKEDSKQSFLISDFQSSTSDIENIKSDSSLGLNIVSLPVQTVSNIFIDSCWLESPVVQLNRPVNLFVKISNSGDKAAENVPIRLIVNGSQRAVASTPIPAGQSVVTSLNFTVNTPGWQSTEVQITDQPITFDDTYYLAFEVKEKLKVLSIDGHETGPYLNALFGKDDFFVFNKSASSQVDYSQLPQQDLVILNEIPSLSSGLSQELDKYLIGGGSIVIFPDSLSDLASYNSFLKGDALSSAVTAIDKVERVDTKHPLFVDVFDNNKRSTDAIDYPVTLKHFPLSKGSASRLVLMQLQGGDPLLTEYTLGKGTIYLFSVPLNPGFSNLARHAMIVPVLYKMALLSMRQPAFSYTFGRELPIELARVSIGSDETFHLVNKNLKVDLIPAHRNVAGGIQINTSGQLNRAGSYELNSAQGIAAVIAFNYDRKESILTYLSAEEIAAKGDAAHLSQMQFFKPNATDLTKTLNQMAEGIALWKYCILLALFFLLAETIILRFWKAA